MPNRTPLHALLMMLFLLSACAPAIHQSEKPRSAQSPPEQQAMPAEGTGAPAAGTSQPPVGDGLSGSSRQRVIELVAGRWRDQEGFIAVFYASGTMTLENPNDNDLKDITFVGQWYLHGQNQITVSFQVMDESITQTGTLYFHEDGTLEIRDEDSHSLMTKMN